MYFENMIHFLQINTDKWETVNTTSRKRVLVEYEIINFLKFEDQGCVSDPDYSYDQCVDTFYYNETLKSVGCTTDLGSNLDNVCEKGSDAEEKAKSKVKKIFLYSVNHTLVCAFPCQLMKTQLSPSLTDGALNSEKDFTVEMHQYIKVTNFRYSYTELELLAELGGYVGLFLGVSVFHLSDLFSRFVNQWQN